MSFSASSALPPTLSSYYDNSIINSSGKNKTTLFLSIQNRRYHHHISATSAATLYTVTPPVSTSPFTFNPLNNHRLSIKNNAMMMVKKNKGSGFGTVCCASGARALLSTPNLQWISTISSVVLMLAKGTAIQKSFLVPLLALQAPSSIISWIKGEYGVWTAFVALLVRLFFFIPGELELPFMALLLVIVSPYQVLNLRGKQEGGIIGLVIAGYLAFQHFSRTGSLQKAFDRGSIVATLAIICITVISCVLLI